MRKTSDALPNQDKEGVFMFVKAVPPLAKSGGE
jgi:hypothetical protein